MSADNANSIVCDCGYVPKSSTDLRRRKALSMHLRAGRCKGRKKTMKSFLQPKNGRFDSAAALDALMWAPR
jgi:hypothetical protein